MKESEEIVCVFQQILFMYKYRRRAMVVRCLQKAVLLSVMFYTGLIPAVAPFFLAMPEYNQSTYSAQRK